MVKHIKDLENIEQKYFIDSKIFYNVIFEFSKSETYLVPCEGNKTIDFLMKEFLKKLGDATFSIWKIKNLVLYIIVLNLILEKISVKI